MVVKAGCRLRGGSWNGWHKQHPQRQENINKRTCTQKLPEFCDALCNVPWGGRVERTALTIRYRVLFSFCSILSKITLVCSQDFIILTRWSSPLDSGVYASTDIFWTWCLCSLTWSKVATDTLALISRLFPGPGESCTSQNRHKSCFVRAGLEYLIGNLNFISKVPEPNCPVFKAYVYLC